MHVVNQVANASSAYYDMRRDLLLEEHKVKIDNLLRKRFQEDERHAKKIEILNARLYKELPWNIQENQEPPQANASRPPF
jgi:hypothetical protein